MIPVSLVVDGDKIPGRLHLTPGDAAVLWVFGAGGGLVGPAGGVYERLAEELRPAAVTSLELDYRHPGQLGPCVKDALAGIAYLEALRKRRFVLVGHSFGGAVVICAGVASSAVVGVAALSSQTAGTSTVAHVSPRPILFMHGEADDVLPSRCSRELYARAREPKALILYPGCHHGLDECRDALEADLKTWLSGVFNLASPPPG